MSKDRVRLINKKIVHKSKNENVLLHHLHRALPITINAAFFENVICANLTRKEQELLLQHYFPIEKNDQTVFYTLTGINGAIAKKIIQPMMESGQFTEKEMTSLLDLYELDEETGKFFLKQNLNVIDEVKIHKIMKKRSLQPIDRNFRQKIAVIFERIKDFEKKDIFTSHMHIDPEHPFFFEHHNDHVPALMVMEAARQLLIACGHKFGHIPYSGMRQILTSMSLTFKKYLELNIPVKIIGIARNLRTSKKNVWIHVEFKAIFYQMNQMAAEVSFIGKSIKEKLFDSIRTEKVDYGINPRYKLNKGNQGDIVIRDKENNEFLCKIVNVSFMGFQLLSENELVKIEESSEYEFYAFFREVGIICGKCQLRWVKQDNDEAPYYIGFIIKDDSLTRNDKKNLILAIKKHFSIDNKREYIDTIEKQEA